MKGSSHVAWMGAEPPGHAQHCGATQGSTSVRNVQTRRGAQDGDPTLPSSCLPQAAPPQALQMCQPPPGTASTILPCPAHLGTKRDVEQTALMQGLLTADFKFTLLLLSSPLPLVPLSLQFFSSALSPSSVQ